VRFGASRTDTKSGYKTSAGIPNLVRPPQETDVVCPPGGAPNSRWFICRESAAGKAQLMPIQEFLLLHFGKIKCDAEFA